MTGRQYDERNPMIRSRAFVYVRILIWMFDRDVNVVCSRLASITINRVALVRNTFALE